MLKLWKKLVTAPCQVAMAKLRALGVREPGEAYMDFSPATLDNIFVPYFEGLPAGKTLGIVDLNWYFDFRNKSGALSKSELEHVINRQIQLNRIEVVSENEFRVTSSAAAQTPYIASQETIDRAAAEYSNQFQEKYNERRDD